MTRATTGRADSTRGNGTTGYESQEPDTSTAWMFNPGIWTQKPAAGDMAVSGLKRIGAFNLEVARFMADRARKNAVLVASLSMCRSTQDAVATWREAAIEAVDDYASEVERLMDNQAP